MGTICKGLRSTSLACQRKKNLTLLFSSISEVLQHGDPPGGPSHCQASAPPCSEDRGTAHPGRGPWVCAVCTHRLLESLTRRDMLLQLLKNAQLKLVAPQVTTLIPLPLQSQLTTTRPSRSSQSPQPSPRDGSTSQYPTYNKNPRSSCLAQQTPALPR